MGQLVVKWDPYTWRYFTPIYTGSFFSSIVWIFIPNGGRWYHIYWLAHIFQMALLRTIKYREECGWMLWPLFFFEIYLFGHTEGFFREHFHEFSLTLGPQDAGSLNARRFEGPGYDFYRSLSECETCHPEFWWLFFSQQRGGGRWIQKQKPWAMNKKASGLFKVY